ncbi:hypothetical protein K2173_004567 [Erythroxylum novogranatense]|uniref:Calponin-homology (CH) domain-containing protein n=1 Tax=Erythroxylum novogranatense TaxID=1862640 RepID=A0AAV8T4R0_9ROSI|nr:hypothetical protein K2173_004567 [Erythroxylum novogranatense]
MGGGEPTCPPSSSLLKDISNFKTPKRTPRSSVFTSPCPQHFFTASKETPRSSSSFLRRHHRCSKHKTDTSRRLKAFEVEQSLSSRKVQIQKEKSLKSLSKSLTTWLNFLFESPKSCGCAVIMNEDPNVAPSGLGKREGGLCSGTVGVDAMWRCPKRQRDSDWLGGHDVESKLEGSFLNAKQHGVLNNLLKDVCSFDDLMQRLQVYLSLGSCKEIFDIMSRVLKSIDEGRLKMKAHCPIITDLGIKEKAVGILMCYNPIWLRIGLHIIFGGCSLLPDGDVNSDKELAFLKMVIEKQFFSHTGLAKAYAYNKMVDGLYRPGYYENLGNIILKRFLLLVLILDRAKSQSTLPLKYGIDGIDGGSPLLFAVQSCIKSSRQVINDFLSSDVMHGEGNLLAHLVVVGYKVSYAQCSLLEYDFSVTDMFLDLQDGIRLCRAIQLLQNDSSILTKMVVPSDTRKKKLANCGLALQYLKHAGVKLHDEDGMMVTEDDIANGDKELTLSLLWNMFLHLQVPLLINKTNLVEEVLKIQGTYVEILNVECFCSSPLELLLKWIQAICEKYNYKIDGFSTLVDGKAIWCLLDYYFLKKLCCSRSRKDTPESSVEESFVSADDYLDAFYTFILSQKLTRLLGNFPEVLQISDMLEHSGAVCEQSVLILLVFLSSKLTEKKAMDQLNFHKVLGCDCQSPERRHYIGRYFVCSKALLGQQETKGDNTEDAAEKFKAIKAWWQDMAERNSQLIEKPAVTTSKINSTENLSTNIQKERFKQSEIAEQCGKYIVERHNFVKLRRSAVLIQQAARIWMGRRRCKASNGNHNAAIPDTANAAIVIQRSFRAWLARSSYHQNLAATKIQNHYRGWSLRKKFLCLKQATTRIQNYFRCLRRWRACEQQRVATRSAIIIQCHLRGWIIRRETSMRRHLIILLQRYCCAWLKRKSFLLLKEAAVNIQSAIRCFNSWNALCSKKSDVIRVQQFVRGQVTQNKLLGTFHFEETATSCSNFESSIDLCQRFDLKTILSSVLKLQWWWRSTLQLKQRTKFTIVIQSHVRGWFGRQKAIRHRKLIVVIQSYWRGYLVRKESRGQLLDLRSRMQNSAKNVDDSMRIINRLKMALAELQSKKRVTGILHICATLDHATQHSKKCCEELVDAGAIDKLLNQIRSVSRSIPDQEVLKHALSTLRNITCYPHLTDALINGHRSVEIILWELLRNKEEGYFLASEILKKICLRYEGVNAMHKSPALLKRLHSLVEELTRKAATEKRNPRAVAGRENTERRLTEATELLKLITES